jgi:hypothetical protein
MNAVKNSEKTKYGGASLDSSIAFLKTSTKRSAKFTILAQISTVQNVVISQLRKNLNHGNRIDELSRNIRAIHGQV